MASRIEPRSFWQWLRGVRPVRVTLASRYDETPRYVGGAEVGCAWCALPCPHSEHAHYIQLKKDHWLRESLTAPTEAGRKIAGRMLTALEQAEIEYQ